MADNFNCCCVKVVNGSHSGRQFWVVVCQKGKWKSKWWIILIAGMSKGKWHSKWWRNLNGGVSKYEVVVKIADYYKWWCVKMGSGSQHCECNNLFYKMKHTITGSLVQEKWPSLLNCTGQGLAAVFPLITLTDTSIWAYQRLGGVGHCCAWHVRVSSGLISSYLNNTNNNNFFHRDVSFGE